jgi:hypothetical protein
MKNKKKKNALQQKKEKKKGECGEDEGQYFASFTKQFGQVLDCGFENKIADVCGVWRRSRKRNRFSASFNSFRSFRSSKSPRSILVVASLSKVSSVSSTKAAFRAIVILAPFSRRIASVARWRSLKAAVTLSFRFGFNRLSSLVRQARILVVIVVVAFLVCAKKKQEKK